MKTNIFLTIILSLFISSCSTDKSSMTTEKQPENYIILLDLSDRLLNSGQAEQDIELIYHIFEKYESTVRNNLIINSKDKFRIVIAPQEKMNINQSQSESQFYLDMSKINIAEKRSELEKFKKDLKNNLNNLYAKVMQNKTKTSDFQGADIWKYFNDYLSGDIEKDNKNRLFILSDGYFDFEPAYGKKNVGHRSSGSSFLNLVRGKANWQELINNNDYGIIPINKQFNSISVCLMEIYPKYANLDEADMLQFVWKRWLGEMNIKESNFIPHTSIPKTEGQIDNYLSNNK